MASKLAGAAQENAGSNAIRQSAKRIDIRG
jgi:hypothetical protein